MGQLTLKVEGHKIETPTGRILRDGVEFSLCEGEMLCIHGGNGSGKSTLARSLFSKRALPTVNWYVSQELRAYLPQVHQAQIFLPLTILDVICLAGAYNTSQISKWGLLPEERLHLKWNSASGGEQKRALIMRLILQSPRVLCLDEPFNNLDKHSKQLISHFLKDFLEGSLPNQAERGSVLLISHDRILDWTSSSSVVKEFFL